jgi:hypothetical protein
MARGSLAEPAVSLAHVSAPSPPAQQDAGPPEPPPPLEANDQLVTVVITAGWAIALAVLLIVHSDIPPRERWWIWTAVAGLGMGIFALFYVPHLKRSRARTAQRRADRAGGEAAAGGSGASPPRAGTSG